MNKQRPLRLTKILSSIHPTHPRISLHFLSHYISGPLQWIMHHVRNSSLLTRVCRTIITTCSSLLVLHCSSFKCPANAISSCPSPDKQTLICHSSRSSPPVAPSSRIMSADVCFGSEWESHSLLECYYGGSQMDVILPGAIKSKDPQWIGSRSIPATVWEIDVGWAWVTFFYAYIYSYIFICLYTLVKILLPSYDLKNKTSTRLPPVVPESTTFMSTEM